MGQSHHLHDMGRRVRVDHLPRIQWRGACLAGVGMAKLLRVVVFAQAEDDEYDGMARAQVRDVETAHWLSLSRRVDSDMTRHN